MSDPLTSRIIPAGWTPAAWARQLDRMADALSPDAPLADAYRAWSRQIRRDVRKADARARRVANAEEIGR